MNPQMSKHMGGEPAGEEAGDVQQESGQHHPPQIHMHSHDKGVTVHIMHHDGRHEKHEHEHGDAEGIAAHVHQHHGGESQDHGYSSEGAGENEEGYGPGV